MHFKFRHLQKIVGGFFLLTVVVVIILLVLVARGQRWFQEYAPYHCYFTSGGGLFVGSSVMIHGLEAGKVDSLVLGRDDRVRVDFGLFKQYADRIREGSEIKLVAPMVGSSHLEISLGPQDGAIIPLGGEIPAKDLAGAGLDELITSATNLVRTLGDSKGDLMQALANINEATRQVSEGLKAKGGRPAMLDELASAAGHLDDVLSTLDDSSPDIRDAIVEARRGLEEVNKVVRALQKSIFIRGNIEQYLKEDSTLRVEGR